MKLRKLKREEHWKTRTLWENIFVEDTKAFLDYYYKEKTADNGIFVMEDDGKIVAMLQLNPYQMRLNQREFPTNYIIAVATDERYRKQGIMGRLLRHSMEEMYERKEPFTFLMPAAEAIYYPYDFRFVYAQNQSQITGKAHAAKETEVVHAEPIDCEEIAEFANECLQGYQVVTVRDAKYYRTLLKEQKSEHGGIVFTRKDGRMTGVCCYAKSGQYEVREPLFCEKEDFLHVIYRLTGDEEEAVRCTAYGEQKKVPVIMARILHLETFLKSISLKEDVDFYLEVRDEFLSGNQGVFHVVGDREQGIVLVEATEQVEKSCGVISIGELTSRMFGYPSKEGSNFSEELEKQLEKFVPLKKVFLNEVV